MFTILPKSCSAHYKEYKLINYLLFIIVLFYLIFSFITFIYLYLRGSTNDGICFFLYFVNSKFINLSYYISGSIDSFNGSKCYQCIYYWREYIP